MATAMPGGFSNATVSLCTSACSGAGYSLAGVGESRALYHNYAYAELILLRRIRRRMVSLHSVLSILGMSLG